MQELSAAVYSVYMPNISKAVVDAQRSVVEKFLPKGWEFTQVKWTGNYSHPAAMTICLAEAKKPVVIFLDIDCIPLNQNALELMAVRAELGMLVGAVQRANHIKNDAHLYVGPFCMALDLVTYEQLNSPTFYETERGDCGEELTYRWRERGKPVYFFWPNHVRQPLWELAHGHKFGLGTTYENMFYHEFCARNAGGEFINLCQAVVAKAEDEVLVH